MKEYIGRYAVPVGVLLVLAAVFLWGLRSL